MLGRSGVGAGAMEIRVGGVSSVTPRGLEGIIGVPCPFESTIRRRGIGSRFG